VGETQKSIGKQRGRRRLVRRVIGIAVLLGLVMLAAAIAAARLFSLAGTSLTRKDFKTDAQAAAFVSDHLPVPFAGAVVVRELTYDRFTDWRLESLVDLGTTSAAEAYLEKARTARRQNDGYCGGSESGDAVRYFLTQFTACGWIQHEPGASVLRIECNTR